MNKTHSLIALTDCFILDFFFVQICSSLPPQVLIFLHVHASQKHWIYQLMVEKLIGSCIFIFIANDTCGSLLFTALLCFNCLALKLFDITNKLISTSPISTLFFLFCTYRCALLISHKTLFSRIVSKYSSYEHRNHV